MFRIGVMGCGSVADFGHIPAILETQGLELAALFDPDEKRLRAAADKFGVPGAYKEQSDFLEQHLDAVVIASPPAFHRGNAAAAARQGCVILCEKPLADSETAARQMIADTGPDLYTAFVYRFSPVADQIRSWIEQGTIGEVRLIRLVYLWDLHGRYERRADGTWIESPRWRGRMLEGGPLVDCGVHQIDLARWWLQSEIASFQASGAWVADYDAPDYVALHMDHENGVHTSIEVGFTYGHTARAPRSVFTYEIVGTGGVIRYDRDGYILEARHGQGTITAPGASEKNFRGMYEALLRRLESGDQKLLPSAEDGVRATAIATEATRRIIDAHRKRKVQLPEESSKTGAE